MYESNKELILFLLIIIIRKNISWKEDIWLLFFSFSALRLVLNEIIVSSTSPFSLIFSLASSILISDHRLKNSSHFSFFPPALRRHSLIWDLSLTLFYFSFRNSTNRRPWPFIVHYFLFVLVSFSYAFQWLSFR